MENIKNIEKNWDEMASDYDGFTSPEGTYSNAIEWAYISGILPELSGRKVLDIGCGSGRFTRYFAQRGPSEIFGLDLSDSMLALAAEKNPDSMKIGYLKASADDLSVFGDDVFDFVFSSTVMHYVADLPGAFSEACRVLRPGGDYMLSLIHPLYSASYPLPGSSEWELRYQDRSVREYVQPWTRFNGRNDKPLCRSYHYTASDYFSAILGAGFEICGLHEPEPPAEWKQTNPERWRDVMNEPVYMVLQCRKK